MLYIEKAQIIILFTIFIAMARTNDEDFDMSDMGTLNKYKAEVVNGVVKGIQLTDKKVDGISVEGKTIDGTYTIKTIYLVAYSEEEAHRILNEVKQKYKLQ